MASCIVYKNQGALREEKFRKQATEALLQQGRTLPSGKGQLSTNVLPLIPALLHYNDSISTRIFSSACDQTLVSTCLNIYTNNMNLTWFIAPITTIFLYPPSLLLFWNPYCQDHWEFILSTPMDVSLFSFSKAPSCGSIPQSQGYSLLRTCSSLVLFDITLFWFSPYAFGCWFSVCFVGSSSLQPLNVSEPQGSNPWSYTLATPSLYFGDFTRFQDFNNKYKLISPKLISPTHLFPELHNHKSTWKLFLILNLTLTIYKMVILLPRSTPPIPTYFSSFFHDGKKNLTPSSA